MLIATTNIDYDKVVSLIDDYDGLCDYVRSLVPPRYKHVEAIYHNTRYYINANILMNDNIPLEKKKKLSDMLSTHSRVVGFMGRYVTCDDMESHVNMNKVHKYYEGEKYG